MIKGITDMFKCKRYWCMFLGKRDIGAVVNNTK